jgi:hypothetical protein
MRYNLMFHEVIAEPSLRAASQADLPDLFRSALREGWVRDEQGAWLLKRFLETYSGSRAAFTDLTGYEAAINGRAIPDLDLTNHGYERARDIARRAYVFARMALFGLNEMSNRPSAMAYISISPVEVDDETIYTGSVTIVTRHDGEPPYLPDLENVTSNAVLELASSECTEPLPIGSE